MSATLAAAPPRLVLHAETAADLMTPNPTSIRDVASIQEAVALLTKRGFSAAPVIDKAGRPVGVVSQTDILVHDREEAERTHTVPAYYERAQLGLAEGAARAEFAGVDAAPLLVRDIMTPVVFSVPADSPMKRVIQEMLALKVHRLFVVSEDRVLIGVISALDVLRHLRA